MTASAGAGIAWEPPRVPLRRSYRWLWVLLGTLLALFALITVIVVWAVIAIRPPVNAMNDYLAAVKHGDNAAAYNMLCRSEQASTPAASFPAAIAPFARSLHRYSVWSFSPFGAKRRVEYRVTSSDGSRTTYRATMVHERGAWRVCDFFED